MTQILQVRNRGARKAKARTNAEQQQDARGQQPLTTEDFVDTDELASLSCLLLLFVVL